MPKQNISVPIPENASRCGVVPGSWTGASKWEKAKAKEENRSPVESTWHFIDLVDGDNPKNKLRLSGGKLSLVLGLITQTLRAPEKLTKLDGMASDLVELNKTGKVESKGSEFEEF